MNRTSRGVSAPGGGSMFSSVSRTRVALASMLLVGAIVAGCASSATRTLPPNNQPPQNPRPAATSAPTSAPGYPNATQPPTWPGPRWTPLPPYAWQTNVPYPDNNFEDPGVNPFQNP